MQTTNKVMLAGCVISNEDGKILLVHRNTKDWRHWEVPGGKIEPGETPEQAAKRELQEELGVEVGIVECIGQKTFEERGKTLNYTWFKARIIKGRPKVMEPEFFNAVSYHDISELRTGKTVLSTGLTNFLSILNDDIYKAAGIIIKDKKLLVERSKGKQFFISPGGSIEEGETAKQALVRELKEEFDIDVKERDLKEFETFSAPAAGQEHRTVYMQVFIVKKYTGEPAPNSEVEELGWINSENEDNLPLGSIFEHDVIPRLRSLNLIK